MAEQYSNGAFRARVGHTFAQNSKQPRFKDLKNEIFAGQKLFSSIKQWESSYEQDVYIELLYICVEEELKHAEYERLMDEFNEIAGYEQTELERWTINASTSDWFNSYEEELHSKTIEDAIGESDECYWNLYQFD